MKQDRQMARELISGIAVVCFLMEAGILWYGKDRGIFSLGLTIGGALAAGMVIHMRWSIQNALKAGEQEVKSRMISGTVFRSMVVIALLVMAGMYRIQLLLPMFAGLLSLKISAYFQPFIHRIWGEAT